ncbi:hypothetical protein [Oxynema aestuarii]|uniref:Uncharacterized protein n=1 Tax=Oxynema aestuarii AP17 TaxID=2064643 RepID=A0A6H1TRW0_9CYAN|nr:hypothetical protein [Oxynema aestuarii]QIZ69281.1 hypothetical protein HCG48_00640 [Oxynema aestuarii AP17]
MVHCDPSQTIAAIAGVAIADFRLKLHGGTLLGSGEIPDRAPRRRS